MTEREKQYFAKLKSRNRTPYFDFKNIAPSERLEYEMLSFENYEAIFEMFGNAKNPFISKSYSNREELESYIHYHLYCDRYSPKRGACDWLFKIKKSGEYAGLLNLYDMNLENFADKDKKCTIGFTTRAIFRRKGYTTEAVKSLLDYIATHHPKREIILGYTEKANEPSKHFLLKMGFEEATEKYYYKDNYDFFELKIKQQQ